MGGFDPTDCAFWGRLLDAAIPRNDKDDRGDDACGDLDPVYSLHRSRSRSIRRNRYGAAIYPHNGAIVSFGHRGGSGQAERGVCPEGADGTRCFNFLCVGGSGSDSGDDCTGAAHYRKCDFLRENQ